MIENDPATALRECQESLVQLQKMESIGQMTGRIAHEFNNQLQNIVAALELVRKLIQTNRVDETERFIASAIAAAQRAAAMNHRLSEFARPQPQEPKAQSLNALVAEMEPLLRTSLPKHVKLELELAQDLRDAFFDANEAKAAILNLVLNAIDALPQSGAIVVITRNDASGSGAASVSLTVKDSGTGMDEEARTRARETFFTTKGPGLGVGLGLTMVDRFARRSGGEVSIESEPGLGTSVTVRLPRHRVS